MSSDGATTSPSAASLDAAGVSYPVPRPAAPGWTWLSLAIGAAGLGCSVLLWQKVGGMQEQLARQAAEANMQAVEARTVAREAQDLVRDAAGRLSVMEVRLNEATLQREQLQELMQNLTRSRDETLAVDIESAIRLAQQQMQLTGSADPLVAALKASSKRLERAAIPHLTGLQHAMERDLDRLSRISMTDSASLLGRLDDVVRLVDELHVANSAPIPAAQRQQPRRSNAESVEAAVPEASPTPSSPRQWGWWQLQASTLWSSVRQEASELLRVSRIDHPDAVLMAPEQAFFVRENLKLKLLNARLGILARQFDASRADIAAAQAALAKFFDPASRRTVQVQAILTQLQQHMHATQPGMAEDTLTALSSITTSR